MPWWALALRLSGLGWYIAICIVGGVGTGIFLDRWIGSGFVFLLVGVLTGTTLAVFGVYRMVLPLMGESQIPEQGSAARAGKSERNKDQM
jgi:F0F1-type ATP synthase assembly protein I